jgi:hypothetical protein
VPSPLPVTDTPMRRLENGWYNSLVAGLHLDPGLFQSRRPAVLLQSDATLWACEDAVPPRSLVFDTSCGVVRFSDIYKDLVVQLAPREDRFRQDVGEEVYRNRTRHLRQLPPSAPNRPPALFRHGATLNAPATLQMGVSRLAQAAHAAGPAGRLAPYRGTAAKPFDFAGTVDDLVELGRNSPTGDLTFDSLVAEGDLSSTWAAGDRLGRHGLWTGSSPDQPPSARFAANRVRVYVRFRSCVVWTVEPGRWYDSSFLNLAFSELGTPPWPTQWDLTWDRIFGPGGCLRNLIAALVVLDGISATVVSDATYDVHDQDDIRQAATSGFWPFYIPSFGAVATNKVSFDAGMTIETHTQAQTSVVVGNNVLDIARYLGRAGDGGAERETRAS